MTEARHNNLDSPKMVAEGEKRTKVSQGSVATRLRCGGIFNDGCIANFPECMLKGFLKSVKINRFLIF